jgi:RNA ligase (TIGR02306 family)
MHHRGKRVSEMARALVTVETVTAVTPIEGADMIVAATIRGWTVVIKKDELREGDSCVYFELDSFLPAADERYNFLTSRSTRVNTDGSKGHVLRTVKLRGVVSQGLALPVTDFPELAGVSAGTDVTTLLGVTLWEPMIPAELSGVTRGAFPRWVPKTDEERIQNTGSILAFGDLEGWVATEKVDGSSVTVFTEPPAGTTGRVDGVCSRNVNLVESDTNSFWVAAKGNNLHALLAATYPEVRAAVQGELYGGNVQGNPLKVPGLRVALFTVIVDGKEIPRNEWPGWALDMAVPVVVGLRFPETIEGALADVDGLKSVINPACDAEGVVWRNVTISQTAGPGGGLPVRLSFKAISNRYIMKADKREQR